MAQEDQRPQQIGIQSNSGGDINIERSQVNIAGRDQYIHYASPDVEQKHNRERMLATVRSIWITKFLERDISLRSTTMITLSFHEQPDAVANLWEHVVQAPKLPEQSLLLEKDIT